MARRRARKALRKFRITCPVRSPLWEVPRAPKSEVRSPKPENEYRCAEYDYKHEHDYEHEHEHE
jgi:hypothetical protein